MPIAYKKHVLILLTLLLSPSFLYAQIKLENNDLKVGRLAFTYYLENAKDIYVIDFGNKTIKPLVASEAIDEYPSWSPDGRKLAFHSDQTKDLEIYIVNADGSNPIQVTKSKGKDENPDWSPDGTKLVFQSSRLNPNSSNLFITDINGQNSFAITDNKAKNSVARWSPRGNEILYSTNNFWPGWDIMIYNLSSKENKQLTTGLKSFCRASWNPTGSSFAFSYGSGKEIDLWTEDKGSNNAKRLTTRPGREYDAIWMDDKNIFFVGETTPGNSDYQIYLINIDSKIATQITSGPGSIRYLSWTPLPPPPPSPLPEELKTDKKQL